MRKCLLHSLVLICSMHGHRIIRRFFHWLYSRTLLIPEHPASRVACLRIGSLIPHIGYIAVSMTFSVYIAPALCTRRLDVLSARSTTMSAFVPSSVVELPVRSLVNLGREALMGDGRASVLTSLADGAYHQQKLHGGGMNPQQHALVP